MTTISELPPVTTVGPTDQMPLSQAGQCYSVTVAQLTASSQPLITVPTGDLLGRQSAGAGAPETISVGTGLLVNSGSLFANGGDHSGFPIQAVMSFSDDVVVNAGDAPGLLPVTALRALFSAGSGVAIDNNGVISVTVSSVAGPAGPAGAVGPAGPAGPAGPVGPGLSGPAAGNSASSVGASDYVALWQDGALAWMTYGQFLGGETIDQLPSAGPAADGDLMMVAQGSNILSSQSFGGLWSYLQAKLPSFQPSVVELTSNTILDSTTHNNRILVASAAITLTASYSNTGPGFSCTIINLSPGPVVMGTGITSGSGTTTLPPGASTTLLGLQYSGGSMVWWSGVEPNAPTITVASIPAPAPNVPFNVSGGIFNDAPTALDYSIDGGLTWIAALNPVITVNAYSFIAAGLAAGTYALRVRDHSNIAIIGASNSFIVNPPTITISAPPAIVALGQNFDVSGTVSPGNNAVQVGLSTSVTTAPTGWVNAVVSSGAWIASLRPSAAGTYYVWAQQEAETSVSAVSGAVLVVVPALSVSAPASGSAGTALTAAGAVSPASDSVNVQLSTQNTVAPSGGWISTTNMSGVFSAGLTPAAGGTYYVWAEDPITGLTSVSGAITVAAAPALVYGINMPQGGPFVHGVGTIGINGSITPPQNIATQVAFSTSNTVAPTAGWQPALVIESNSLWAIYYNTPASAGSYYCWVQTTTGTSAAVSSFTITVT